MPVEFRVLLHERNGGEGRRDHVFAFGFLVKLARPVFLGRRAAVHGQEVGREREIALDRQSARDVLDMRVEPAVLVDDDHRRPLAQIFRVCGLGAHEIAVDLALGELVGHALADQPAVVRRHDRGLRVIVLQQRQERDRRRRRARQFGQAIEKFAAVHAAMGEAVVQTDDLLVHGVVLSLVLNASIARR